SATEPRSASMTNKVPARTCVLVAAPYVCGDGKHQFAWQLPTKQRYAEIAIHSRAALLLSADAVLISNF
ncbi:MAG: hypothetical protein WBE14_12035, partial [Xanthobacteraceae bacterium]